MKIAILGTRGIPNKYGGFEQFAEYLSVGLVKRGHDVTVYNPHFHDYKKKKFEDVNIEYVYSPEDKLGAAANFIYDFFCLRDALKKNYDIILECGYQSVSVSYFLTPINKSIIVTNMDGLEWKREKWSPLIKRLTKKFEKWGVKKSHALVSDNEGIREYLLNEYGKDSYMIPYGAEDFKNIDRNLISDIEKTGDEYFLLIARLEPENNIEMILDGYVNSNSDTPFLVVGNHHTKYGDYLKNKYKLNNIKFLGGIYDAEKVNNLRYFSKAYFHGHSVGGTNPSLLEAMACNCLIIAHDNEFNKSVLNGIGLFFENKFDVSEYIKDLKESSLQADEFKRENKILINTTYSWDNIINQYEQLFEKLVLKN